MVINWPYPIFMGGGKGIPSGSENEGPRDPLVYMLIGPLNGLTDHLQSLCI